MASSNGGVPPGFRFHPTDEELLHYYLRKKVCCEKLEMEVIREVDLNKMEPWDLQERCKIGATPQKEWYLFSHKDRKYPTGSRTNRATNAGFWKATGRDKCIRNSTKKMGMRKTLVFYRGRAPHGHKTDWIMHEYRLEEAAADSQHNVSTVGEEGWVVCRVYKKKKLFNNEAGGGGGGGPGHHHVNTSSINQDDEYLQPYSHMMPPYSLMIPSPLALGAAAYHHYSSSSSLVPPDSALVPMMQVKHLIDHHNHNLNTPDTAHPNPNSCDHQQLSAAHSDQNHHHNWGMINDGVDSSRGLGLGFELEQQHPTNTLNQISPRTTGEMDFWGYSK